MSHLPLALFMIGIFVMASIAYDEKGDSHDTLLLTLKTNGFFQVALMSNTKYVFILVLQFRSIPMLDKKCIMSEK